MDEVLLVLYKQFLDWLVPALVSWGLYYLNQIAKRLNEINHTMISVVLRTDDHERRITRLELK